MIDKYEAYTGAAIAFVLGTKLYVPKMLENEFKDDPELIHRRNTPRTGDCQHIKLYLERTEEQIDQYWEYLKLTGRAR